MMNRLRPLVCVLALGAAIGGCKACSRKTRPTPEPTPLGSGSTSAGDPFARALGDAPIDWTRPLPTVPPGGVAQEGYVGSDACTKCHAGIAARYARHSMASTGLRPLASLDPKWLAKIFDAGEQQTVHHARSGFDYRPYREGDRYFVEELLLGKDGSRVHSWTQPLTDALSAGSYGLAFYFRRGDRAFQIPIDYYAGLGRWEVDPGAIEGNPRFSKVLDTSCIHCHGDYPRQRPATEDVFLSPMPAGVGCERCHGPGEKHAKSVRPEDIVNPARLSPARALDVCVQCHQSSHDLPREGHGYFDFRPGQALGDARLSWIGEPGESDRVGLLAHPERLARSACFRASAGKLTCTTCHDPHESSVGVPATSWDGKCKACHEKRPCTETPAVRAAQGDHCVACHMRKGPPTNPSLVTITDHWIQRHPPPIRPGRDEHPERLVAWSTWLGEPASGRDVPALEAIAWSELGRDDQAMRSVAGLLERSADLPQLPPLYEWLAGHYARTSDLANVTRADAAVLRFSPDSGYALLGYARALLDQGTPEAVAEASSALDRAIALDPDDAPALETKGVLLFRSGRVDEARPLFERSVASGPSAAAAHVALAVLALRADRLADAALQLEAARHIEPRDPWILDQLQRAYQKSSDVAHAAEIARAVDDLREKKQLQMTGATLWLPPGWR